MPGVRLLRRWTVALAASVSARSAALRQLDRIELEGAFIGLSADGEAEEMDAREERQALEYVAGVTRWRRWLDFLIGSAYRGDLEKMEPTLRQILRIGLYDLLFLATPPHAALNEAVELAKRRVRSGAGALVNGILRALLRQKENPPVPNTGRLAEDLAIRHSHPAWMVERWLSRYGQKDTEALLAWNNSRPVYGVRVNTLKTASEAFRQELDNRDVSWEPSPYLESFVRLPRLQGLYRSGVLAEGWCAVQDESAGLVVRVLDPQPGDTLVDTCAAPGGKSIFAAQRMRNEGRILAFDVHEGRLGLVRRGAEAQGVQIIETQPGDFRQTAQQITFEADRVLLDAPCSGLGVLSKRADLRWHRTAEEVAALNRLQDDLLDAAARAVRPGGLLVYSTCTIEPEENEERVTAFLGRHPEFSLESAAGLVPEPLVTPEGYFRTFPPRDRVDGAFAARLRRRV